MAKAVRVHGVGGPEVMVYEDVTVGQPGAGEPLTRADAGPSLKREPVVLSPDPVVTSSTPANQSKPAAQGYSAPLPRPARIERAGSILMIRPAGG